jgi:hypothetical protein
MVEAHTNVKLPKRASGARNRYPLGSMAVGAFYFLPGKTTKNVAPHVSTRGKHLNRRFATRACFMMEQIDGYVEVPADHPYAIRGVGVWRIK